MAHKFKPKPTLNEVFEALDKAPLPDDFLSPEDRDRSLPQERPELDKMFDELEEMTDEDLEWLDHLPKAQVRANPNQPPENPVREPTEDERRGMTWEAYKLAQERK